MQVRQLDDLPLIQRLAWDYWTPIMDVQRPVNSLEQSMKKFDKKKTMQTMMNEFGPTSAITLSKLNKKELPHDIQSLIMSKIEDPWYSTVKTRRETIFLVKYLGQRNFSNLLKICFLYRVVMDIMQSFVNLLLKDSVTHFKVQAAPIYRDPLEPDLSLVPISLDYMKHLVGASAEELEGKRRFVISNDNDKIKKFYEFSYNALLEDFKNTLKINNIEPASFVVDQEFREYVSWPIIYIFQDFMFPVLNKLCELNQYQETHEDVKNIDFMDLLTKREPTPTEYKDMKKFFFVPEKTLARQRSSFARAVFDKQTQGQEDEYQYGGRRSYQKKNRTNKRLKKNTRIKNKKKCSSSRKIHKKYIN
jgi:hypothetical protein